MAFMAAENFEDKNSISARMIQARFTNFGRFSCMAMLEYASENDNAAAGTTQPASARFNNPANYNSPYDRNWILYFATVFAESLQKEVGNKANYLEVNVLEFWQQQCEEPAAYRAPVPTEMWSVDPKRLGTTDAFDTSVEVRDFAPLVSFGSLRQLRSANGAAAEQWPEDATTSLLFEQNRAVLNRYGGSDTTDYGRRLEPEVGPGNANDDRVHWTDAGLQYRDDADNVSIVTGPRPAPGNTRRGRGLFMNFVIKQLLKKALGNVLDPDPYKKIEKQFEFEVPSTPRPHFYYDTLARQTNVAKDLLRDVYCNPDYDLTIEQAVGNPPPHEFQDTIVDSSTSQRPKDMVVYGNLRGGDVNRGYEANGPGGQTPSYKDTSLQSWVYVTSSDDPNVEPGFHRLADLRIWPDTNCNRIKSQPCGSVTASGSGSTTSWLALAWFQLFFNLFGRRLQSGAVTYIKHNDHGAYVEPSVTTYRSGTEALLNARCSTWLASNNIPGATPCQGARTKWYADSTNGCSRGRLELVDTSVYEPRSMGGSTTPTHASSKASTAVSTRTTAAQPTPTAADVCVARLRPRIRRQDDERLLRLSLHLVRRDALQCDGQRDACAISARRQLGATRVAASGARGLGPSTPAALATLAHTARGGESHHSPGAHLRSDALNVLRSNGNVNLHSNPTYPPPHVQSSTSKGTKRFPISCVGGSLAPALRLRPVRSARPAVRAGRHGRRHAARGAGRGGRGPGHHAEQVGRVHRFARRGRGAAAVPHLWQSDSLYGRRAPLRHRRGEHTRTLPRTRLPRLQARLWRTHVFLPGILPIAPRRRACETGLPPACHVWRRRG